MNGVRRMRAECQAHAREFLYILHAWLYIAAHHHMYAVHCTVLPYSTLINVYTSLVAFNKITWWQLVKYPSTVYTHTFTLIP